MAHGRTEVSVLEYYRTIKCLDTSFNCACNGMTPFFYASHLFAQVLINHNFIRNSKSFSVPHILGQVVLNILISNFSHVWLRSSGNVGKLSREVKLCMQSDNSIFMRKSGAALHTLSPRIGNFTKVDSKTLIEHYGSLVDYTVQSLLLW